MKHWIACLALLATPCHSMAADSWPAAVASMRLHPQVPELNPTNCVRVLLASFQSNQVVKALVFLPGATDELYTFHRVRARLTNQPATLLDAVAALTNQSRLQVTFHPPLLLLHTAQDVTEAVVTPIHAKTAEKIGRAAFLPHILCDDRDWDYLQPLFKKRLGVEVRPWRWTRDSWHFYRHSFAGWGLNGREAIEAACLSSQTQCKIERGQLRFQLDRRSQPRFGAGTGGH